MIVEQLFNDKKNLQEGVADEFMSMAKSRGYNPQGPSPEERVELKAKLKNLEAEFDPGYEFSDDHRFWKQQRDIAQQIDNIKQRLKQGVEEGWNNSERCLDEAWLMEDPVYRSWKHAGRLITEAALTADQIQKLFTQVQQGVTAAGGNRTMIGKGKDAATAVGQAWEQLKGKVANSGPVQGVDKLYDQAAEKLKQATGGDQGVMQYVQKYRDFAQKHPIAQSLIYSALIAAAGISGVGVGGAAALGLFKMVDKLLQGEKFSSAAYSGAKTGAVAYGAGQIGQALKGTPAAPGAAPDAATGAGGVVQNTAGAPLPDRDYNADLMRLGQLQRMGAVVDASGNIVKASPEQIVGSAAWAAKNPYIPPGGVRESTDWSLNDQLIDHTLTKLSWALCESEGIPRGGVQLTEVGINTLFAVTTMEGAGWDAFKAGAKKAGSGLAGMAQGAWTGTKDLAGQAATATKNAVGKAAGQAATATKNWIDKKGENLTTKVTADKLMSAWKNANIGYDSNAVYKFLTQQGIDPALLKTTFKSMKIPVPRAKSALGGKGAFGAMAKDLTGKATTPGSNAFGAMAGQLTKGVAPTSATPTPTPTSTTAPAPTATAPTATAPTATAPTATAPTPAQIRQQKLAAASRVAQASMQPAAPKSASASAPTTAPTSAPAAPTTATAPTPTHVYANNTEVPWAGVNPATQTNYTVDQLQGVTKRKRFNPSSTSTAPAAAGAANFAASNPGYGKITYSMKPMTGIPGMKPPAAPTAPSVPKAPAIKYNINLPAGGGAGVKSAVPAVSQPMKIGGQTLNPKNPADKKIIDKVRAQTAKVAEALKRPVAEMLTMVETKEDVARIKKFIDQTFIKYGAVTESAFAVRNQLIEHVTQVAAHRRKEHSQQMAK